MPREKLSATAVRGAEGVSPSPESPGDHDRVD
jgi:hypothetical protein